MTDTANIAFANTRKKSSHVAFRLAYLHLTKGIKVKVKVMHLSTVNISQLRKGQTLLLPTNRKSHVGGFRLAHLNLILVHSKGPSQGYAHFYCE